MRLYIPAAKHAAHMCLKRDTPADRARWDAIESAISAAAMAGVAMVTMELDSCCRLAAR